MIRVTINFLHLVYIKYMVKYQWKLNIKRYEGRIMDGTNRANIKIGSKVLVVQKQDQRTGKLTEGIVKRILTNSPNHHHGIKVMLEDGIVGRVQEVK
jgi:uncharacterized repeat protein (TIGR03833 family)